MSESLCFHDMSRLDIYEYSPVFNDTDPWAVIRTHTSANKHVSAPSYPKSDVRSKRWSYESSASTDSSSSDTCSMPSFPFQEPSNKRSSIIYKPSNPDDKKTKARSSIVYKKSVPSSPCGAVAPSYPDLPSPSTSTPRTREKKLVTTLALAAWACTVGAVLSRRKMAARRRSLHLKPLQLPAQASLTQERAAFCWKVVAAHVQTPKARPQSIHFKPLVLPVQLNDSTEYPLLSSSDLRRLLNAVANRGIRGLISVARALVFSVYLASTCCFRVPQFFLSLLSSVLLALIRRILPLRLL